MTRQAICADPDSYLSQATIHNGTVYCSGAIPVDANGQLVGGSIGDRAVQCIKNLEKVLLAAGSGLDKVLKVNIYVTSMADIAGLNEAYKSMFTAPRPARACVEVSGIAPGIDIEIECIGYI